MQQTRLYRPVEVGRLLATVHIRYVEPGALEKVRREHGTTHAGSSARPAGERVL